MCDVAIGGRIKELTSHNLANNTRTHKQENVFSEKTFNGFRRMGPGKKQQTTLLTEVKCKLNVVYEKLKMYKYQIRVCRVT